MRRNMWIAGAFAAAVAVAAGCADDGLGPEDSNLTAAEVADLALDLDDTTGDIIFGELLLGGFGLGDGIGITSGDVRTFERKRDCPLGGNVSLAGTIERERDGNGAVEFTLVAAGTKTDCTRQARNDLTIKVNGGFTLEAYRKRVNGKPVGLQTTTKKGQFDWERSDGKSGSCAFDLTSVRNPEAGKRTIKGTMCGREIDREVNWNSSGG